MPIASRPDGCVHCAARARANQPRKGPSTLHARVSSRGRAPACEVLVAALLVGCGSSKSSPSAAGSAGASTGGATSAGEAAMSRFTVDVDGEPPVPVALVVPADWEPDTSTAAPHGPSWKLRGARLLMLAAVSPGGDDDEARMRKAIRMQYGDADGAERRESSGGRVWVVRTEGDNLHARMFVPYARGVVMGVAMMEADARARLPDIRAAFETLTIASAAAP